MPGDVGQARGPEMEAGMEPSLGTISSNRYKVQKGVLGHSLPAAVMDSVAGAHYREQAEQGKACPVACLTHPPGTHPKPMSE